MIDDDEISFHERNGFLEAMHERCNQLVNTFRADDAEVVECLLDLAEWYGHKPRPIALMPFSLDRESAFVESDGFLAAEAMP